MKLSRITQILLALTACAVPSFAAKTHIVNNTSGNPSCAGTFKTIQAAINASAAGDTVFVCASGVPYDEQLTISTSLTLGGQTGATLQPSNLNTNFNDPNGVPTAALIYVTPPVGIMSISVSISGLIVDGINNTINNGCATGIAGIAYRDASGTIAHNTVKNIQLHPFDSLGGCQTGFGIYAESTGANANGQGVAINQNSIHEYQKGGIVAFGPGMQAPIERNVIKGIGPTPLIGQNGIELDNGTGQITGNTVTGNAYTGPIYGSCDILTFSDGLTFSSNTVGDADYAIYSTGNSATISSNNVFGTTLSGAGITVADGTVSSNTITNSPYAAVDYYGTNSASITRNTIVDAKVGVLNENNSTVTTTGNKYYDVLSPVLVLPPPPAGSGLSRRAQVSPFVKR